MTQAPTPGPLSGDDTALVATINYLRADEGDTVSLLCDNPDFNGQPNNAVECNGGWTDWKDERFTGDSLFAALNNAALAKAVATKTLAPKPLAAPASPLPEGGGDMDWQSVAMWMGFSASVIKSGEPWSDQCQQHYDEAKAAFARLAAPTGAK